MLAHKENSPKVGMTGRKAPMISSERNFFLYFSLNVSLATVPFAARMWLPDLHPSRSEASAKEQSFLFQLQQNPVETDSGEHDMLTPEAQVMCFYRNYLGGEGLRGGPTEEIWGE